MTLNAANALGFFEPSTRGKPETLRFAAIAVHAARNARFCKDVARNECGHAVFGVLISFLACSEAIFILRIEQNLKHFSVTFHVTHSIYLRE